MSTTQHAIYHGPSFISAVGPKAAEMVSIIESHYYDDGDGRAVDAEAAVIEIVEHLRTEHGADLP